MTISSNWQGESQIESAAFLFLLSLYLHHILQCPLLNKVYCSCNDLMNLKIEMASYPYANAHYTVRDGNCECKKERERETERIKCNFSTINWKTKCDLVLSFSSWRRKFWTENCLESLEGLNSRVQHSTQIT